MVSAGHERELADAGRRKENRGWGARLMGFLPLDSNPHHLVSPRDLTPSPCLVHLQLCILGRETWQVCVCMCVFVCVIDRVTLAFLVPG